MSDTITVSREDLEALIDQRVAQATRRGSASIGDALMDEAAGQPPRCVPLKDNRQEMAAQAEIRGGVWHPEHADIRKNKRCTHAHPTQCDRCWTPETEARWAYALGLTDDLPIPLDAPEEFGSQRPNVPTSAAERKRLGGRLPSNMPG